MKRFGFKVIVLVALAAALFAMPLSAQTKITILHTNDMHAQGIESASVIGYSRIAGYVAALKAKGENVLVLDAGDTLHGLPWANLERGASVVKLMNAVGYSAMAPGNHDFNYGQERLVELSKTLSFPLLAANIYKDGVRVFPAYKIITVAGIRVAIVGIATQETLYKADPAGLKGLVFEAPVAEARRVIQNEISGQYDLLIGLVHLGIDGSSSPTSLSIAKSLPEFDLIVDGHSHSSLAAEVKNNTTDVLIVSADANGVSLGSVEINLDAKKEVVSRVPNTLTLTANAADLVSSAAVKKIADDLIAAQAPMLAEVVGQTAVMLDGTREVVRAKESNLGRLIANGMLATTGAELALMNGGGIRTSIAAGPITKGQVYTVLPFGNYLWTTPLTGAEIKTVLENGVSKLPAIDGRYPHLAGASFTFDASRAVGDRVTGITIKGAPYDPAKKYVFCTLNFEANGGDGYTMLVGKTWKEFPIDADSFMAYLKALGTVTESNIEFKK